MKQKYLKPLAWVLRLYWQSSRLSVIWISVVTIFDGLINIVVAYGMAKFISSVSAVAFQKGTKEEVYFWIIIMLILAVSRHLIQSITRVVREKLNNKVEIAGGEHFAKKIYELSQEQFDNQEFNTKIDRARNGFFRLTRSIETFSGLISSLIGLIGSIGAIMVLSPILGVIMLLSLIPTVIIEIRNSNRFEKMYRQTEPYDRTSNRIRWLLFDPIYMPEIRLMQAFKDLLKIWRKNMNKSLSIEIKNRKIVARNEFVMGNFDTFLDAGYSIYLFNILLSGVIGFDRFMFLRSMFEQVKSNLSFLGYSLKSVYEDQIAIKNYGEIFNTLPAIPTGEICPTTPITIEFKNVSFSYPNSDVSVINNMSFVINPGEKIALVGENGAGKSTIVKLILRQYLPKSGSILVNGQDIKDINTDEYLSLISSLNQEFNVIESLTIKTNLTIGIDREIDNQEIYRITDLVDATKFLKKLPHQLNSRLDPSFDKGTNLSGGQKQRLAIARTLLRNGDLMILDEPTSSIDAKAEYFIFNNIFQHHAGKTTLIISHRFSTVRRADTIYVIEAGKITEKGSHQELLNLNGTYKEMFDKQAEGYK